METIEVRYKLLDFGVWYHKYIVYTDSNGNQFAARAGPAVSFDEVGSTGSSVGQGGAYASGMSGSSFGNIEIQIRDPRDRNFRDFDAENDDPSEVITSGENLSVQWNWIKQAFEDIEKEGLPYRPLSQNSNTVVDGYLGSESNGTYLSFSG